MIWISQRRKKNFLSVLTRAKTDEDLERLQEEMDKTNEQINIRLKPKGKVPDVDLTAGGGSERKDE